MSEAITNPACALGCTDECKAKVHGCASECPALPWQPAPSPQPAVPEWLNSAFPNCEDLQALGLKAPTPAQFAQQLYKRWKAKLEKVEEELCALKATHARPPAVPVVSDEQIRVVMSLLKADNFCFDQSWPIRFARAILALRPQSVPMTLDRWAVVRETALDVGRGSDARTGGRPELGYALISDAATFDNEAEAVAAINSTGLPVGWVVIHLSRLLPDIYGITAKAEGGRDGRSA